MLSCSHQQICGAQQQWHLSLIVVGGQKNPCARNRVGQKGSKTNIPMLSHFKNIVSNPFCHLDGSLSRHFAWLVEGWLNVRRVASRTQKSPQGVGWKASYQVNILEKWIQKGGGRLPFIYNISSHIQYHDPLRQARLQLLCKIMLCDPLDCH